MVDERTGGIAGERLPSESLTREQLIQANARLAKALGQANYANDLKSHFLASVSHELRSPMTAILGLIDVLGGEVRDADVLEKLEAMRRNGTYLVELLNDLLDLSRIEAGKLSIETEPVDLRRLIEDLRSLMNARVIERKIPLHFEDTTPLPPTFSGDRKRIRQILVNLIGNALKFTDEGEVRVVFRLEGRENPGTARIVFEVHDTGIGMTADELARIFEPYVQGNADTERLFGGSGLGLSISRLLAKKMKGEITAASTPNEGSCFAFSMPLTDAEAASALPFKELPLLDPDLDESSQVSLPRFTGRILLADDRRDVWLVGKYFLEKCGATVAIAADGKQAIDAVTRARDEGVPFSMILMDMQMPHLSGKEAVAELRRMGITTPIIALTADAMHGQREACLQMGCDDYCPKPIDGPYLMKLIASRLSPSPADR